MHLQNPIQLTKHCSDWKFRGFCAKNGLWVRLVEDSIILKVEGKVISEKHSEGSVSALAYDTQHSSYTSSAPDQIIVIILYLYTHTPPAFYIASTLHPV